MSAANASRFAVLNDEAFTNPSKKNKKKKPEAVVKPTPKKVENPNAANKKTVAPVKTQVANQPKVKPQQNVAPKKAPVVQNQAAGAAVPKKAAKPNPQPKKAAKNAAPVVAGQKKNAVVPKEKGQKGDNANVQLKKLRDEVTELRNRNSTLLSLLQTGEMKEKQELMKQNQLLSAELSKLKGTPVNATANQPKQAAKPQKGANAPAPAKDAAKPKAKKPAAPAVNVAAPKPKQQQAQPKQQQQQQQQPKQKTAGAAPVAAKKPKAAASAAAAKPKQPKPAAAAAAVNANAAAKKKKPAKKSKN